MKDVQEDGTFLETISFEELWANYKDIQMIRGSDMETAQSRFTSGSIFYLGE